MTEIYKKITNNEAYEVSNLGNIRHFVRGEYIPIKPYSQGTGYLVFRVTGHKYMSVHRAVAEAFIENPEGKPCVDHINGVRDDNRAENLRWVTHKENTSNTAFDRQAHSEKNCQNFRKPQPVYCVELKQYFDSMTQAAKYFNTSSAMVVYACSKPNRTCFGLHFRKEGRI